MPYARFRQKLLYAVVLLLVFGALNTSNIPQAVTVREYIQFAVNTDLDVTAVVQSAKGLGSFSSRINWENALRVLAPTRP